MTKHKQGSFEEQLKVLQKHFGSIIVTVKDLKGSLERLEKKVDERENKDIVDIIKKQEAIEKVIMENAEAMKRLDKELLKERKVEEIKEVEKDPKKTVSDDEKGQKRKKVCRYFNRGYCKYKLDCRFVHSQKICEEHLKHGKCGDNCCNDRHPKECKWFGTSVGCRRDTICEYLHVTPARDDDNCYKCEGCKSMFEEKEHVIKHVINGNTCYFCLNCDDWIQIKANVFNDGWTLLDSFGYLRMNI